MALLLFSITIMDKNHEVIPALFVIPRKYTADKTRFGAATGQEMLRVCIHMWKGTKQEKRANY